MPGSYAVSSIDRASRWCGALEQCGTKRIFFIIGDGFILQWSRCEKTGMWYVAFRCRCAERWVAARVLCFAKNVKYLTDIFKKGGGFVFNQVHNIMGDIKPENIVSMLKTAYDNSFYVDEL